MTAFLTTLDTGCLDEDSESVLEVDEGYPAAVGTNLVGFIGSHSIHVHESCGN